MEPDPAQSWWRLVLCNAGASEFLKCTWPEQFDCFEGRGTPTLFSDEDFLTHRQQWFA